MIKILKEKAEVEVEREVEVEAKVGGIVLDSKVVAQSANFKAKHTTSSCTLTPTHIVKVSRSGMILVAEAVRVTITTMTDKDPVIRSISIHKTVTETSLVVLAIWMVAKGDQNLDLEAVQGQKV